MQYVVSSYLSLPDEPGVYQFFDRHGKILYVGKAKNLKSRVSSYFQKGANLYGKTALLVARVAKIKTIPVESEIEALLLEANLIKKYAPKYNISLKDGKAYPLIRITVKAQYPAVLTARHAIDKKSIYFGPFPSSNAMRSVLRLLRKIFPYQTTLNHPKKKCLYYHLGLCPCVPARQGETLQEQYKKTIRHIIDFLQGNTKKVVQELEKERESLVKKELFENAAHIQKQLDNILYIIQPTHKPFEYETNPHLKTDLRMQEMVSLQEILHRYGTDIAIPRRIECYDNSNIQGSNPTSSLVVLTNGEIDTSQYRKFKIKTVKGPDDFASMQEVLTRRLKHTEWPYPDLIIVDGGKGQVGAAREVLEKLCKYQASSLRGVQNDEAISKKKIAAPSARNDEKTNSGQTRVTIPLIGLAKRDEIIITSDFREIRLPKSSPALQLVMRIRDEAHRFAITFHRKLRSKITFS